MKLTMIFKIIYLLLHNQMLFNFVFPLLIFPILYILMQKTYYPW